MDNIWKKNAKVSFEEILTTFDKTQIDSTVLSFNHLRVPRKQAFVNDFVVPPRTHTEIFSINESADEMRQLFFGSTGNCCPFV
jgi:hypothetical protein